MKVISMALTYARKLDYGHPCSSFNQHFTASLKYTYPHRIYV